MWACIDMGCRICCNLENRCRKLFSELGSAPTIEFEFSLNVDCTVRQTTFEKKSVGWNISLAYYITRVTTLTDFIRTVRFSSPLSGPLLLLHVLLFGQLSSFSRVKVVVTPVCVCVCDCVKERMREAECLIKIVAVLLKLLNNSVLHRRLW